jgi:hypothetical protein
MTLIAPPNGTPVAITPERGALAETDASIARYLGAGDQMLGVMDLTFKVCIGLAVVVIAAWAIGLLPAAVRLV